MNMGRKLFFAIFVLVLVVGMVLIFGPTMAAEEKRKNPSSSTSLLFHIGPGPLQQAVAGLAVAGKTSWS